MDVRGEIKQHRTQFCGERMTTSLAQHSPEGDSYEKQAFAAPGYDFHERISVRRYISTASRE
jgi:hypothetical protein